MQVTENQMEKLIVERSVEINAPVTRVWEVLTTPSYIKQWDDIPEGYGNESLKLGSEITWHMPGGKFSKLTAIIVDPNKLLRLSLYVSNWEVKPAPDEVAYTYTLSGDGDKTNLSIEIGDFKKLPDGDVYFEASEEFAETSAEKIKDLAENS